MYENVVNRSDKLSSCRGEWRRGGEEGWREEGGKEGGEGVGHLVSSSMTDQTSAPLASL